MGLETRTLALIQNIWRNVLLFQIAWSMVYLNSRTLAEEIEPMDFIILTILVVGPFVALLWGVLK